MTASQRLRVLDAVPPELVVHDVPGPCAYLPDRQWRLPLRLPLRTLGRAELDARLAQGDRRQGRLLYRPSCESCQACIPIRLDVGHFSPSRTHRRVWARGGDALHVELGPLAVSEERVRLYNRHKLERGLSLGESETNAELYGLLLGDSCCESFELRYWHHGQLVAVAIVDRGARSLSAVYCYFDPSFERLSLGTFSILKQVELCQAWGLRYLYLGLYISESQPMRYKARFLPHELLLDGHWARVERPQAPAPSQRERRPPSSPPVEPDGGKRSDDRRDA